MQVTRKHQLPYIYTTYKIYFIKPYDHTSASVFKHAAVSIMPHPKKRSYDIWSDDTEDEYCLLSSQQVVHCRGKSLQ